MTIIVCTDVFLETVTFLRNDRNALAFRGRGDREGRARLSRFVLLRRRARLNFSSQRCELRDSRNIVGLARWMLRTRPQKEKDENFLKKHCRLDPDVTTEILRVHRNSSVSALLAL